MCHKLNVHRRRLNDIKTKGHLEGRNVHIIGIRSGRVANRKMKKLKCYQRISENTTLEILKDDNSGH